MAFTDLQMAGLLHVILMGTRYVSFLFKIDSKFKTVIFHATKEK